MSLVVGLALAILVGISLGLLGGGGSILMVPVLVYVLGRSTHEAIATSLVVVGVTSLAALVPHARADRVRWRTGLLFGATSMLGAYGGGRAAHLVPGVVLLLGLGAMMLVTAGAMMRARPTSERGRSAPVVVQGLIVGALTGLVGAGGGFVVVPALVLLGALSMRDAIGTSLLVIAMNSSAALIGHLGSTSIDLELAAPITCAAVVGSALGASLAGRVRPDLLRRAFAWLVLGMAVLLLSQEVPRAAGVEVRLDRDWPWVLGLAAIPVVLGAIDLALMKHAFQPDASR
ncbi:sulfite exporter TauE/SafE family protein [Sandaracinus amylolyticus]|uniref:Probable membrane transporter protein n=1 Tax=Sandaracinus amylolyticus TaxID=927083 RepID=A0A0F6VYT1_9BACT|nr:sulfite exporter TauE/SafE family protein [Sandaracinus amylolyticus]AKF03093.1 hypothetical protein DB32_000242 [Sandaracinus amylolyticus]